LTFLDENMDQKINSTKILALPKYWLKIRHNLYLFLCLPKSSEENSTKVP